MECSECAFEYTGTVKVIKTVLLVTAVVLITVLITCALDIPAAVGAVMFFVFAVSTGFTIYISLRNGRIAADDEKLTVSYFSRIEIRFSEIDCANCEVDAHGDRWGNIYYELVLKIEAKDSRSYTFCQPLNLESGYPAKHPDEYKRFVEEQSLTKMCALIKSRIEKGRDISGISE